jgi:eukaryotic translation initiation factor 2C
VQALGNDGKPQGTPRTIAKISPAGASGMKVQPRDSPTEITVAEYFKRTRNKPLQFPHLPCVEVNGGALLPFEICFIPPGQIMRRQVPPEMTKLVLDFATKKPQERLASIKAGIDVLAYGQSDYVRQFGMHVDTTNPLTVDARVLMPPTLRYGPGSRQPTIVRTFCPCSDRLHSLMIADAS